MKKKSRLSDKKNDTALKNIAVDATWNPQLVLALFLCWHNPSSVVERARKAHRHAPSRKCWGEEGPNASSGKVGTQQRHPAR